MVNPGEDFGRFRSLRRLAAAGWAGRRRRWLLVWLVAWLGVPTEADAGGLAVTGGAAAGGSALGLEVTLGETCTTPNVSILGPTFSGDSAFACDSVTANDVEIISPGATFRAAQAIVLGDGFSVASGVDFTALVDPFANQFFAWVENDTPFAEMTYMASFDLNLDSVTLAGGDDLGHLNGYSANGDLQFRAVLRRNMALTEDRLVLFARDGGVMVADPVEFLLPAGYRNIQISWSAGAVDGEFLASIDGAPLSGRTDLENDASRIAYVRWGAVDGTISTTTGTINQDNFWSSR